MLCRAPPPRRVTFRRQRGLASGERAPWRGAGDRAGGKQMSLGRVRGEGSANGGGEAGEPQDPAAALRAGREWRRRCLLSASQIAIWRLRGPAGAATRATLMARFLVAERAPSRSLSSLGTCPSASRGLLSMGNRASPRSQRAGSGRAGLRGQAQRPRRLRAASAPQHPPTPASRVPTPPSPRSSGTHRG